MSVERIKDPSLRGKPVVVGGSPNGRGVVASASYEARKYGVRSAMPASQAIRLCPGLILVHGNHHDYSDYSEKIYRRLLELIPVVERASIDEMYLDLSGCEKLYRDLPHFIAQLQTLIDLEFKLPCTISLASNKTVAKIATDTVKPEGICIVEHGKEKEFLAPLPIKAIPGVGKKSEEFLRRKGFRFIADLQAVSAHDLAKLLGKHGSWLHRVAEGKGRESLHSEHVRKSISHEQTFSSDLRNKRALQNILYSQVESVCSTLRERNWKARTVTLKLRDSDFHTITRGKTIEPSNLDPEIFRAIKELFERNYTESRPLRLVGVHLANFVDADEGELPLFPSQNKKKEMLKAVDALRKKFGTKIIHVGGA